MSTSQGLGWPRTYFIWGWVCGALSVEATVCLLTDRLAPGAFTALCAFAAWFMARHMKRPLFAADQEGK